MTGEEDVFGGDFNFLDIYCPNRGELAEWVASLGSHYEISITNIKKFSVGSPIQAAADAMTGLVTEHRIAADDVEDVEVLLPPNGARIVNDRSMPDVNCQYCMAAILLDGGRLTFDATHSYERMSDPEIVAIKSRVRLTPNPEFSGMERQRPATVRIRMKDGTLHERHVPAVHGTWDSPMTHDEVDGKGGRTDRGRLRRDPGPGARRRRVGTRPACIGPLAASAASIILKRPNPQHGQGTLGLPSRTCRERPT